MGEEAVVVVEVGVEVEVGFRVEVGPPPVVQGLVMVRVAAAHLAREGAPTRLTSLRSERGEIRS